MSVTSLFARAGDLTDPSFDKSDYELYRMLLKKYG